jgi:hypothetical protein
VTPSGNAFRILLPQGYYSVRQGPVRTTLTALSGGNYQLDLRREKAVDYSVTAEPAGAGDIVLRIIARGTGQHTFSLRADNLELKEAPRQNAALTSGMAGHVTWHAHVLSADTPWVAVVLADNALVNRREVTGTASFNVSHGN